VAKRAPLDAASEEEQILVRPSARGAGSGAARIGAAGCALLAALALAACGGEAEGDTPEVRWFVAIQPGGSIQEIAKHCTEQADGDYKIELELLPTDADPQREQLVRRLGAEDSTIDIIGMDVIWTAEFANAGWLLPFDGERAKRVSEGVFDTVIDTASFEGELYGAPFNSNTQLLWYREDLVKEPPKTWDQMISVAESLPKAGTIQVQANRYEGFTVWVSTMIASAGGEILSGPEEVSLERKPTEEALSVIGKLANSDAAPSGLDTSDEDSARLAFEAGDSAFMLNYTFAYASAKAEAPDVFKNMGFAKLPEVVEGQPSAPPLGGFNIGVSKFSEHPDLAFDAAECINSDEAQLTATELDGLPPTRETLYKDKIVTDAFPGFEDVISASIDDAAVRPLTPAYTDVSLAIQRALHPPEKIDPEDPGPIYDELKQAVEDAVLREGLL
jgi:multiple sugar transport system substrate-binding protein